jgi:DNA processing protein
MQLSFPIETETPGTKAISPMEEMVAYEALWQDKKMTFKSLSRLFASHPGKLPSELVPSEYISRLYPLVKEAALNPSLGYPTNLLVHGSFDYPSRLRQAEEPVEILYYSGYLDLLNTRAIAVVGTRKPSEAGLDQVRKLTRFLVERNITIVSGLATGVDTMAHVTAIAAGGHTIAVIGTPLDHCYPAANADLQKRIAREHLLITQVPFIRYREQSVHGNRLFFPERNKTMSALTEATVIVEAGETSGTLIQARAALAQGRKLFILDHCFRNDRLTWPTRFLQQGAIRGKDFEEILPYVNPDQNR